MIGCPHLLQGTVPSGCKSPGMKTFVSHQPHVTIRNCSLMTQFNLPPTRHPTTHFLAGEKNFDKWNEMLLLIAGKR
jgi:hypothetical protein